MKVLSHYERRQRCWHRKATTFCYFVSRRDRPLACGSRLSKKQKKSHETENTLNCEREGINMRGNTHLRGCTDTHATRVSWEIKVNLVCVVLHVYAEGELRVLSVYNRRGDGNTCLYTGPTHLSMKEHLTKVSMRSDTSVVCFRSKESSKSGVTYLCTYTRNWKRNALFPPCMHTQACSETLALHTANTL